MLTLKAATNPKQVPIYLPLSFICNAMSNEVLFYGFNQEFDIEEVTEAKDMEVIEQHEISILNKFQQTLQNDI